MKTVKQENQSVPSVQSIIDLARLSPQNRLHLLQWLDALSGFQKIPMPFRSEPLLPSHQPLLWDRNAGGFVIHFGPERECIFCCQFQDAPRLIETMIRQIGEEIPSHLMSELPAKLRRLVKWRSTVKPPLRADARQVSLSEPQSASGEVEFFYRLTWQHYRDDELRIVQGQRAYFMIGRDFTERIGMRSGRVRHRYHVPCIDDGRGRLYSVEDRHLTRLRADGSPIWRTNIPIHALDHGLLSNHKHLLIPDVERLSCLSVKSGGLVWQKHFAVAVHHVGGKQLIGIHATDKNTSVLKIEMHTGRTSSLCSWQGELIGVWWRHELGLYIMSGEGHQTLYQLQTIDPAKGDSYTFRLPPSEPVGCVHYANKSLLVLGRDERQLLCLVTGHDKGPKIFPILSNQTIVDLIAGCSEGLIAVTEDSGIICVDISTGLASWHQVFHGTPTDRLGRAQIHGNYLLVPSTPPKIIFLPTGEIIGTISDKLYHNALPILIDNEGVILRDDYGYIGRFDLSGFIAAVRKGEP